RELRAHRAILEKYAADRQAAGWRVERASMAAYHRRAGMQHVCLVLSQPLDYAPRSHLCDL
ncbi:MAG: hypothetical protein AAFW64_10115, partial [Pseudomonadota bacterium]